MAAPWPRNPPSPCATAGRAACRIWPDNLFCMVHGRERGEVEATIAALRQRHGLDACAHDILFSLTRFKQNGARDACS